jgi:hypothetical protein
MKKLIIYPDNEALLPIPKVRAEAGNIREETKESPYDPKFVDMIKTAEKRGNYKGIDANDLWGSINLI